MCIFSVYVARPVCTFIYLSDKTLIELFDTTNHVYTYTCVCIFIFLNSNLGKHLSSHSL